MDFCVVDLGFGDAGKGTIVDYLARQNPDATIVRFNGGAQAAHNVITDTGVHHTFAQFGSGTLAGNRTHLSQFMLVNPMNMLQEARHLSVHAGQTNVFDRLTVDSRALVTTRLHMAWNRIQEICRGAGAHGSCGQGIGETVAYNITCAPHNQLRVGCLHNPKSTLIRLRRMREFYNTRLDKILLHADSDQGYETLDYERDIIRNLDLDRVVQEYQFWDSLIEHRGDDDLTGDLIFEGAQGIGLDETYGTTPHVTWSDCTPRNAMKILNRLARARAKIIGVTRTYTTRHGAGPFPTEAPLDRPEPHNGTGTYQGAWRVGHLDCGLLTNSLRICTQIGFPVEELAVTHMDTLEDTNPVSVGYNPDLVSGLKLGDIPHDLRYRAWTRDNFIPELRRTLNTPVTILSYGPTAQDKKVLCDSSL